MICFKSLRFFNHEIFGNKIFDFTMDGVHPVNNVIIAGENGSGKTRLLEILYYISNTSFYAYLKDYSKIIYEVIIDLFDENYCNFDNEIELVEQAVLTISENESKEKMQSIKFMSNGNFISDVKKKGSNDKIQSFKMNGLYSNVDINYKPRRDINGTTNKTLDNESISNPDDMASEIIQLLVDIASQDSFDLDTWIGSHRGEIVPEQIYHPRLKRFTQAFQIIFGKNLEYGGIKDNSIPIFKKNECEIKITSLSSGEKQIIFRGIHLLRNKNSLKGVPVFIDEPEISMHPKWEENIFNYYKNIFLDNSVQTSQIFIATHSEHILADVLKQNDCLVIKINETIQKFYKGGTGSILPTITIAEIKYTIFDLYTTDFHNLLYGYISENCVLNDKGNVLNEANVNQTDIWLKAQGVSLKNYYKQFKTKQPKEYGTLPTYIRNCIDHPDAVHYYTDEELTQSTDQLIQVILKSRENKALI